MDILHLQHRADPFGSSDPGTVIALGNLQPIGRTVLTFLAIDPGLARDVERDRLRTLVKLVIANPSNDLIGMAFNDLRKMWKRGFPIPAFDDDATPMVDIDMARALVTDLRTRYHTCWPDAVWEEKHVRRVLVLCGFDGVGEGP
ncbi:hypothetical protein [Luteibacter aegosomatissinici]|uniref:hypothetical protein n=1 Tax=Luteibacter aegosomatissinici TaxID=2911539 RepID=UPI001FF924D9|nr:hypothetical protein [Luteibacter aegosomatissinici]UPG92826.1 hypothetical protein L2Y97_13220 [Luteibacter aegosomatissinici]